MRRRDLLAGLSWTVLGPTVVSAQERVSFTIGFLHAASQGPNARSVAAFVSGLQDMGLSEGKSIFVEYRWAEGQYDRLPTLVSDLITGKVAVIVASGGTAPAHAAKLATQTIPIVFISGDDPIRLGLVKSFNRPEGNLTGVVFFNSALAGKRVELLHEIMPSADTIAYLTNPENSKCCLGSKGRRRCCQQTQHQPSYDTNDKPRRLARGFSRAAEFREGGIGCSGSGPRCGS